MFLSFFSVTTELGMQFCGNFNNDLSEPVTGKIASSSIDSLIEYDFAGKPTE